MFERQERMAILLITGVALTVIAAHVILAGVGKQPFAHPFSNTSADGELVVIEGQIDQITLTKSGGNVVLDMENLTIFLPAQAAQGLSLQKGDSIIVYGTVQTYRGKKEILVDSPEDIKITSVSIP
jgi:DNA/RNA endonuclease YhcR with UshA esterase domain